MLVLEPDRLAGTQVQSAAYDLSWNVSAGGGATFSTGGAYSLGGTIGAMYLRLPGC